MVKYLFLLICTLLIFTGCDYENPEYSYHTYETLNQDLSKLASQYHNYKPIAAPSTGLADTWIAGVLGIPALTVEVRPNGKDNMAFFRGGHALPKYQIQPTVEENLEGAWYILDYAVNNTQTFMDSE